MSSRNQTLDPKEETSHSTPIFRPKTRRTPSFSSSISWDSSYGSSSYSSNEEFPTFSPPKTPPRFRGVPFSWEQLPGIPKHQLGFNKTKHSYSEHLLPLPPAGNSSSASEKRPHREEVDPFFAALVECSKDEEDQQGNIWKEDSKNAIRRLRDRFGFLNSYTSCKSSSAVSDSVFYVRPRSRPHYLLARRSR